MAQRRRGLAAAAGATRAVEINAVVQQLTFDVTFGPYTQDAVDADAAYRAGLLIQGVPGVPQDPLAPHRGPLGPSPDRDSAIGNASALVPGPLAAR